MLATLSDERDNTIFESLYRVLLSQSELEARTAAKQLERALNRLRRDLHRKLASSESSYLVSIDGLSLSQEDYRAYLRFILELIKKLKSESSISGRFTREIKIDNFRIRINLRIYKVSLLYKILRTISNPLESKRVLSILEKSFLGMLKRTEIRCHGSRSVLGSMFYQESFVCRSSRMLNLVKLRIPSASSELKKSQLLMLESLVYVNLRHERLGLLGIFRIEVTQRS
jgi:hypothetical protein